MLLPDTPIEGAQKVASAVLDDLRALRLEHRGSAAQPWVTVSIGVSSILMEEDVPQDELVARADRALYLAKTRGRDRVEIITSDKAASSRG